MKAVERPSVTTEWGTPKQVMAWVEFVTGWRFDFDPAASHRNHMTPLYSAKSGTWLKHTGRRPIKLNDQDGLELSWRGSPTVSTVWLNPPYGDESIRDWVTKVLEEVAGTFMRVAVLLPARTEYQWFHELVAPNAKELMFLQGRVQFEKKRGVGEGNPTYGSMVALFWDAGVHPGAHTNTMVVNPKLLSFRRGRMLTTGFRWKSPLPTGD